MAIVKKNFIQDIIGHDYIFYLVWNTDDHCWYRPRWRENKLGSAVFLTQEEAEVTATKYADFNYKIIDISLAGRIPEDLLLAHKLDLGIELVYIKLRQLIEVFVVRNNELRDSLKEQYSKDRT